MAGKAQECHLLEEMISFTSGLLLAHQPPRTNSDTMLCSPQSSWRHKQKTGVLQRGTPAASTFRRLERASQAACCRGKPQNALTPTDGNSFLTSTMNHQAEIRRSGKALHRTFPAPLRGRLLRGTRAFREGAKEWGQLPPSVPENVPSRARDILTSVCQGGHGILGHGGR